MPDGHVTDWMYRCLFRIRLFEERITGLAASKAVPGYLHTCIGSEAIATGVMAALRQDDWITSTYRSHGHAIAKNVDLFEIAAEIHGRAPGVCRGRGGSMHISDFDKGMLGAFGIVAAGPAVALGAAVQERRKGSDRIAVSFFGDGAVHNGVFHEAAGLAKHWNAPLLLVCENNGYAEATATDWHLNTKTVAEMMAAYAIPARTVDGMDMFTVYDAAHAAVERMRAGGGPELIEFKSYRFSGQYEGDKQAYQPASEIAEAKKRDPVLLARQRAAQMGFDQARLARLEADIQQEVDDAFTRAEAAPWPAPEATLEDVYAPTPGIRSAMRELTVKDAINEALRECMRADPDVVLFGEDIAGGQGRDDYPGAMDAWGGPFGVTKGLCTEFGRDRVRDTTIAEAGFFGAAIGGAMVGMRPVCELMYADFAGVCFDQMMNQAAKMRYMFGGKQKVPMVMRTVVGGGFRAGAEHSQTLYSLFAHIPGLKVVAPYSAADAKGLLIAAIRDDDPVVFFEHKRLYMQTDSVPEGAEVIPLGGAGAGAKART